MKIFRIPMLWNICVVSVEFALPGDNPKFCVNLRWDTQGRFLCVIRFVRFRTATRSTVKFGEWKHPTFSTGGNCKHKRTVPSCVRNGWDLYDHSTGAVRSHHVQIVVDGNTASLTPYVTRACIDSNGKIYMNSADSTKRSVGVWQNHAAFISTLKDEPIRYREGR